MGLCLYLTVYAGLVVYEQDLGLLIKKRNWHNLLTNHSERKCNPQRFSEDNSDFVRKLRIFCLFHVGYFFKIQFVSLKQTKSV